ncbi:MAG TPA: mercuric reductase [Blastocatellia bacterium]|nr:mercuric reductase [Blastocatellia bacterium]
MADQYDAIVIGSGQAGKPLSIALAKAGMKTALVERGHIGGTCINVGCTPTKTMVASGRVAYLASRSADYGVHTGPVTVSLSEVRRRKQKVVDEFREGSLRGVQKTPGLDFITGEARFTGPDTIEVRVNSGENRILNAKSIFINTGGRPSLPSGPGLDRVPVLDSTSIMELDDVPEHLIVLGGGYIGLEFGQMFRRFGSKVTVIQRGDQLLSREDPDIAEAVAEIVREDGVTILFSSEVLRADREGGTIKLAVKTPSGEQSLTGSHLLAAIGRTPNTDSMNLDAAGVETDKHGFIKVNERLETSIPGIYALGDVKGGPAFTHISYDDFRIIRTNLLEGGNASIMGRLVPYTVFIDPQLGRIGLSETEARAEGRNIRIAKLPMEHVARAIEVGETRGFMKVVVDAVTNQILGCAVLGIEGGEIMSMLEIAMLGRVPYTVLRDAVFAHPTLAESLNNLFMAMDS